MTNKELLLKALEDFVRDSALPKDTWATFRVRLKLTDTGMETTGCEVETWPDAPVRDYPELKRFYVKKGE